MASEIKLPELGENLSGGDVLDVKVAQGDTVTEGQTLLEVEAEKSTVEVPAPMAGRVAKLLVKKGDSIQVGQTLCFIEDGASKEEPAVQQAKVREAPAAETEPEARDAAARGDEPEAAEEAEKEVEQTPASKGARPTGNGRREETKAPAREEARPATGNGAERPAAATPTEPSEEKQVPAAPATRRLARELGVDLSRVQASASGGRVTQEDIKAYVRDLASGSPAREGTTATAPLPDFARWGPVERRPLDGVRRKTAEQMSLAWRVIPHVTQHDVADITELDAFRKSQEGQGAKLTVTAFVLKAAAVALRQFPQFNASLDQANDQLIVKQYYHLGVAVDTDRGLLVPVIHDVDKKSVQQLAEELGSVAERARQKKLALEEMRGGTFTITNLGGIGGTGFTPIVNYPEVAILGLSRSRWQPVVREGQVVPRLLLPLSLSYDHRVIDGAAAARFARRVADMLENPLLMVLHA